jgi:GT2 family glycosyltransferase
VELSIVIVSRNTRDLTCAAIRSIKGSQDRFDKEILLVDNGSADGTGAAVAKEFPDAIYLRSETNLGFARANNLGARGAQGDLLLLLNSDARLKPDSLDRAVEWMRTHGDCGIAGAQLLNPDGSRQNSIANFPTLATELLNKSLLRRLFPGRFPGKERVFSEPIQVESVIGAFFLTRTAMWRKLGGFDERFFFFFEETDFCLQARRLGWKVQHLPQVEVFHEQGKSAGQWAAAARIEYWRSRYAYFRKNDSRPGLFCLAGGLWVRLLFDSIIATLVNLICLGQAARWRQKAAVCHALVAWHLRGCPAEAGLPR